MQFFLVTVDKKALNSLHTFHLIPYHLVESRQQIGANIDHKEVMHGFQLHKNCGTKYQLMPTEQVPTIGNTP